MDILKSVGSQSEESVESVLKKKKKAYPYDTMREAY